MTSNVRNRAVEALLNSDPQGLAETAEQFSRRTFRDALNGAVLELCRLATTADSEKVRYDAAKYVVERCLGRLQDSTIDTSPLNKMLAKILDEKK